MLKLNWSAIFVSALVSVLLEAAWFSVFMIPWLAGMGITRDWLINIASVTPAAQYGTALVCSIVAATVISILTRMTGPQTARRGILIGILVWLGFVATSWAREYVFEVRSFQIYFINTGYFLIDLILMGAITGAWKTRPRQRHAH
jgi:ABC-type thiamin/hydroxymethylpyrimidine transport system permease subunit